MPADLTGLAMKLEENKKRNIIPQQGRAHEQFANTCDLNL
jgi:hypothetical protein